MIEELIVLAGELARQDGEAARRRAVSTLYYAYFHALAKLCADVLAPMAPAGDYAKVYRCIDHGPAPNAFEQFARERGHVALVDAAITFRSLQSERHKADYMPERADFLPQKIEEWIDRVSNALVTIDRLAPADRRSLAIALCFPQRKSLK